MIPGISCIRYQCCYLTNHVNHGYQNKRLKFINLYKYLLINFIFKLCGVRTIFKKSFTYCIYAQIIILLGLVKFIQDWNPNIFIEMYVN